MKFSLLSSHREVWDVIKRYRYYVITVLFLICIGLLWGMWQRYNAGNARREFAGASKGASGTKSSPLFVQVFRAKRVHFQDALEGLMGTVRGSSLELRSTQEETLVEYHYDPGSYIKKGSVIAEQDHTRVKARMRQEEINMERKKTLYTVGGATKMELEQARESFNIARKDYQDTFIIAPKNGYLGEVLIQEGELVSRQDTIAYFVSAEEPFFIETSVMESKIPVIRKGQKASISIDALPDQEIEGTVLSISPEVTTTSRMIPVRIGLPNHLKEKLKPGLSASSRITIYEDQNLLIPKTSLIRGKERIFIVGQDNQVYAKDLVLGYESRDYVTVKDGLSENEMIINKPDYYGMKEGKFVRYSEPEEYIEK